MHQSFCGTPGVFFMQAILLRFDQQSSFSTELFRSGEKGKSATRKGRKSHLNSLALRFSKTDAVGFWLRCSSVTAPLRGMLPRRASPEPKIDATNVVVFMERGTQRPLKKPPGERTGPTRHADLRGNLVGRVPPRREPDAFQQRDPLPP